MRAHSEKPVWTTTNERAESEQTSGHKVYTTPKLTRFGTIEDLTARVQRLASKSFIST